MIVCDMSFREGHVPEGKIYNLSATLALAAHLEGKTGSAGVWYEFMGNAAFLKGDYGAALDNYEQALIAHEDIPSRLHSIYLKLSDLSFKMGDVENERYYREQVYGSLVE
jgi:hypothetical protein